jgi:hypothetical protein
MMQYDLDPSSDFQRYIRSRSFRIDPERAKPSGDPGTLSADRGKAGSDVASQSSMVALISGANALHAINQRVSSRVLT